MSKPDVVPMDVDSSTSPSPADDDPITASYPVYLNPALPLGRRLLVLQHPNRTDDGPRAPPTELRLKAESGMVEVDVPLDYTTAYDKDKGVKWGRTLQQSSATKNGGSHGLAGGFGFGAVTQQRSGAGAGGSRRGTRTTEMLDDDDLIDWSEAVRQDKVLRTQTLGGQYPETDEVQYMVGVFQGKDLHLTPVSSLVHLRPQLHHLDATTQMERQAASKESSAPNGTGTGGAPSGGGGGSGAAPRAIHMTIKTTVDGETVAAETIADRLRSVQSEPWRKMKYTDENEEAAWDVYNESLFLTSGATPAPQQEDDKSTAANTPALDESVPAYASTWGEQAHLEAVSGMKKPVPVVVDEEELQQQQQLQVKLQAAAAEKKAEEDKRPATRRPRGGAAAGARRGGRKASAA